jgi:hypothetical protein
MKVQVQHVESNYNYDLSSYNPEFSLVQSVAKEPRDHLAN